MTLGQLSEYLRGWQGTKRAANKTDDVARFNLSLLKAGVQVKDKPDPIL